MTTYAKIISETAIDRNPPRHARLPDGRTVAGPDKNGGAA